ncbi:MAG TPA: presqualene diphosphate synthase HpnD [Rhizomicrobium sp.]|jgi:phytoene synthase
MADEPESEVAARAASGSSFYLAMRLLPKEPREAMYAVYRFCRGVDDIADDTARPRAERIEMLQAWRISIDALYAGTSAPLSAFLESALQRYRFRKEDFLSVIDGMAMDVAEDIVAPEFGTLDLYCDRVASAVGRLSIKVFGMDEEPGFQLAHHLGRALQLTNILRDLDEDAALGRLYLPHELLEGAGVVVGDPVDTIAAPQISSACRALGGVAHQHYRDADRIMSAKPRGELRPPRLMGAVYSSILLDMEKRGWTPPRRRVRPPKARLFWMLFRHGLAA